MPLGEEGSIPSYSIMEKTQVIEADFIILQDGGYQCLLECPRCGIEFDVNAHTEKNLIWHRAKQALVAMCPIMCNNTEIKPPCKFDYNGECLVCDCWPGQCAWFRLQKEDYTYETREELLEMFKDYLAK